MGGQIYVTVKEQISGSDARCGESEVNRGLKKERGEKEQDRDKDGEIWRPS